MKKDRNRNLENAPNLISKKCILVANLNEFTTIALENSAYSTDKKIQTLLRMMEPIMSKHGVFFNADGGQLLILFDSVGSAFNSIQLIYQEIKEYNLNCMDVEQLHLGTGIGYGEVLLGENSKLSGIEVENACKLGNDTAEAKEILLTEAAWNQLTHIEKHSVKEKEKNSFYFNKSQLIYYSVIFDLENEDRSSEMSQEKFVLNQSYYHYGEYEFYFHFVDMGTKAYVVGDQLQVINRTISDASMKRNNLNEVKGLQYMYIEKDRCTYFDLNHSIVLDVGNDVTKGIVDNHDQAGAKKSAMLLLRENPSYWEHLLHVRQVNIIVHKDPDFDCIASSYYLMSCLVKGMKNGVLESEAQYTKEFSILEKYCTLNDNGALLYSKEMNQVPHIIMRFFGDEHENVHQGTKHQFMLRQVLRGNILLQAFMVHISMELWNKARFSVRNIEGNPMYIFTPLDYDGYCEAISYEFEDEILKLENDRRLYDEAVKQAEKSMHFQKYIRLPILSPDGKVGSKLVPGISFHEPLNCELHKEYAREDGYIFTFIPTEKKEEKPVDPVDENIELITRNCRVVISVTEKSELYLGRIGEYLERAEKKKEDEYEEKTKQPGKLEGKELYIYRGDKLEKLKRAGIPRFSEEWCENSDPWYDGRYNQYTIVDAPACGSLLIIEEIYTTMLRAISEELENFDLYTILPFTIRGKKANQKPNIYRDYKNWIKTVADLDFSVDEAGKSRDSKFYDYINDFFFMDGEHKKKKMNIQHEKPPKANINQANNERAIHYKINIEPIRLGWNSHSLNAPLVITNGQIEDDFDFTLELSVRCIAFRYGIGFFIVKLTPHKMRNQAICVEELVRINQKLMQLPKGNINHSESDLAGKEIEQVTFDQEFKRLDTMIIEALARKSMKHRFVLKQIFKFGQPLTYNSLRIKEKSIQYEKNELGYKLSNGYLIEQPYQRDCYTDNDIEDTWLPVEERGDMYLSKNGCTYISQNLQGQEYMDKKILGFYDNHQKRDFRIFLLVLQQRVALLNFSSKLAEYTNQHNYKDKYAISKLRKSFLDFTTQGWFGQISGYEFTQGLFKKWKEVLEVDSLYEEVEKQIEMMDEYNQVQFAGIVQGISFFGIWLVIINLIGGTDLIDLDDHKWDFSFLGISNQWVVFLTGILIGVIIVIYTRVMKNSRLK